MIASSRNQRKSMQKQILTFAFALFTTISFAQENQTRILQSTNSSVLDSLSESWSNTTLNLKNQAIVTALAMGWPIRREYPTGRIIELQRLDSSGRPLYYTTHNTNSARSIKTDRVHTSGSAGLNLGGAGIIIGEWDSGAILSSHEQFNGRITQIDNPIGTSGHATHVAGTLIGDGVGIGNSAAMAKGMAPHAHIDAYDFNNDTEEMTIAAGAGRILSNHSYGFIGGYDYEDEVNGNAYWTWWGPSAQFTSGGEDTKYGKYDQSASNWDMIAENAPYYLIVKSAGNDRNDNPIIGDFVRNGVSGNYIAYNPDHQPTGDGEVNGGFDCISSQGNAKNILTVGAVDDVLDYTGPVSVHMSSFSSWGPTDDGRIKPDITANGVALTSAHHDSNSDYRDFTGTSMSSPSVTGSAALLQEHYEDTHGSEVMRSATLKALIIHTADEAGLAAGPDYRFGWGLMNTERAAQLISLDVLQYQTISEEILENSSTYTLEVESDGVNPLRVTVVWTDPASTASGDATLDDPSIKLINDLDVRITKEENTYMPYVLNPANPVAAATTGDNVRDNVEQVHIAAPSAGIYNISVEHKSTLHTGSQPFSIIVSGGTISDLPPSCVILTHPMDGAVDVAKNTDLSWEPAAGDPTGYKISVGTAPGANDIIHDLDVGNVTSYDLPYDLPGLAEIYVQVLPYNAFGEAVSCGISSFTTQGPFNNPTLCQMGIPLRDATCNSANNFEIEVQGVTGSQLGVDVVLSEVRVIIQHKYDNDIDMFLTSPNGVQVELSTDNGSNDDHYGNPYDPACYEVTIFTMSAIESIDDAEAPFIGEFLPAGDFVDFEDGSNPNGVWTLRLCDDAAQNVGEFEYLELVFDTPPSCTHLLSPSNGSNGVPASAILNWSVASGGPSGYYISAGTAPGGNDVFDNLDVGNVTSYGPGNYPIDQTIYVTITPYNSFGNALSCVEESFSTASCSSNLVIEDLVITNGTYLSSGDLQSQDATVPSGGFVIFGSNSGVLLNSGFEVQEMGVFTIMITGCSD